MSQGKYNSTSNNENSKIMAERLSKDVNKLQIVIDAVASGHPLLDEMLAQLRCDIDLLKYYLVNESKQDKRKPVIEF